MGSPGQMGGNAYQQYGSPGSFSYGGPGSPGSYGGQVIHGQTVQHGINGTMPTMTVGTVSSPQQVVVDQVVVERPITVERQIMVPAPPPPVQHVRHVVVQHVSPPPPVWREPEYDPYYKTLAERFPMQRQQRQTAPARPEPEEEVEFKKEKKLAVRSARPPTPEEEAEEEEEISFKKERKLAVRSAPAAKPAPVIEERLVEVEVPVDKIVHVEVPVDMEQVVEREKIIEREIERVVEVPVTVERIVEVAVPYEKIVRIEVPVGKTWKNKSVIDLITKVEVQKIKFIFGRKIMCTCYVTTEMTLRTERIVYKDVPVPVQMNPERVVIKEVPQPYEVIKEVPMPVERIVTKEILVPMERVQQVLEQDEVIVRKEIKTHRNVLGEELRPAAMTQEAMAEAQRLHSLSPQRTYGPNEGVVVGHSAGHQMHSSGGLYTTTQNGVRMAPAYSPTSVGLYGSDRVVTSTSLSPQRIGASGYVAGTTGTIGGSSLVSNGHGLSPTSAARTSYAR